MHTKTSKIASFFAHRRQKVENSANKRYFRLNLSVFNASVESASDQFRVNFTEELHYDTIIFNIHGRRHSPLLTPIGACSLISKFCFPQNSHPKFDIN